MNDLTRTLLILAVGIIGGMLFFKFGCTTDEELQRVLNENEKIRSMVDSLDTINQQAEARLDSLRQQDQRNRIVIDSLQTNVNARVRRIIKTVESLDAYEGTPTDLLRELNEFVHSPFPALPDTTGLK